MAASTQHGFPPDPPASLTDAAEIIRNDWAAFSSLERLSNHWMRPAWPEGAQAFYWLIPLRGFTELRAYAQACQQALAPASQIDPVPMDLLHLTLHRVGSANAISERQLAEIAFAATKQLRFSERIRLSIGPLAGSTGAIRFTVTPWIRLATLHDQLVAATHGVVGGAVRTDWRPHVSIAYNNQSRPAVPLVDRIRGLRDHPAVEVTITEIELVKLVRIGRVYEWTTKYRFTLAGRQDSPS